jgi:WD40 repeat protein
VGSYSGLRIWKFPSGRLEAVVTTRPVRGTLFSPDGRFLVSTSGTEEKSVTLWETATWSELARVHGHVGAAWSVGFSPDGRRFATGGETPRDAIKLWDTATQRELLTLRVDGLYFLTQGFSPDGNVLMATSLLGVAHLWRAPSWEDIAAAERALP